MLIIIQEQVKHCLGTFTAREDFPAPAVHVDWQIPSERRGKDHCKGIAEQ